MTVSVDDALLQVGVRAADMSGIDVGAGPKVGHGLAIVSLAVPLSIVVLEAGQRDLSNEANTLAGEALDVDLVDGLKVDRGMGPTAGASWSILATGPWVAITGRSNLALPL